MALAPIILFAYNRPKHTRLTLEQLKKNKLADESLLYVFLDGPKANASQADITAIREVKEIVRKENWCKEVVIQESEHNLGLAASVIKGVTEVINKHGKAIVLEDDLLTDVYFLEFMIQALDLYEKEEEVACISAYIYPVNKPLPETFFIKGADCWGWATWKRAWDLLEKDGQKLLKEIESKDLSSDFDFFDTYPYTQMLRDQVEGKNSSWAILWYASAYLKNKLCLYPGHSLIQNIGNDGSGTHAGNTELYKTELKHLPIQLKTIELKEDILSKKILSLYFQKVLNSPSQQSWDSILRKIIPVPLKRAYKKLRAKIKLSGPVYGWSGNYKSWNEVAAMCGGYDKQIILDKVKTALLKVKEGDAAYERDSVAFRQLEYSENLYRVFTEIASAENKILSVIDFGGSLGSLYYQYRKPLKNFSIKWRVVEQAHFVTCGNEMFANNELSFYNSIEESMQVEKSDVLLLSSVLAYLPEPKSFLKSILKYKFKYIVLYRTAFVEGTEDRLTLQRVPPQVYKASYPAWFFNEEKLLSQLSNDYTIVTSFNGDIETEMDLEGQRAYWKGFVLKHK